MFNSLFVLLLSLCILPASGSDDLCTETTLAGHISGADDSYDIVVRDNKAYVAMSRGGFLIYDVSNPASPMNIGGGPSPCEAQHIFLHNDFAYLSDYCGGLWIFNLPDDGLPIRLPPIVNEIHTIESHAFGSTLLVIDGDDPDFYKMRVFNIDDPANTFQVGTLDGYHIKGVASSGTIAYLAIRDPLPMLACVDLSNPATPTILGTVPIEDAGQMKYRDGLVYIASRTVGLTVVDVSNPTEPVVLGSFESAGLSTDIALMGPVAVVSRYNFGFDVIDIRSPEEMILVESIESGGRAYGIDAQSGFVYLADDFDGVKIYELRVGCQDCIADFDTNGDLEAEDISLFLAAFMANEMSADMNIDGVFDFFDISVFIQEFVAGCP